MSNISLAIVITPVWGLNQAYICLYKVSENSHQGSSISTNLPCLLVVLHERRERPYVSLEQIERPIGGLDLPDTQNTLEGRSFSLRKLLPLVSWDMSSARWTFECANTLWEFMLVEELFFLGRRAYCTRFVSLWQTYLLLHSKHTFEKILHHSPKEKLFTTII